MCIIGFKLLLESQYLLIPLIQAPCQRNHDISLLQKQLLVPIYLRVVITIRCLVDTWREVCRCAKQGTAKFRYVGFTRHPVLTPAIPERQCIQQGGLSKAEKPTD